MCRRAQLELEPTPLAPGAARRFVTSTLLRWGAQAQTYELCLAISELVTNSVLHAGTTIEVKLNVVGGVLEASVRDHDSRPPIMRPARLNLLDDLDALPAAVVATAGLDARDHALDVGASGSVMAGRGMWIVEAIADEWGTSTRADGKEVWLTMPTVLPAIPPCECAAGTTVTASGRRCVHISGPWDDV